MTQRTISFTEAVYKIDEEKKVNLGTLTISPNDLIVLIGGNGSGKTSIARALNEELELESGVIPSKYHSVLVSFEKQMELFQADYEMRNSDCTTADEEIGITPAKYLKDDDPEVLPELIKGLNLEKLMDKPIRLLSGGEGRKVLIAHALAAKPNLIIFDTPFDALDVETRAELLKLINEIHIKYQTPTVLIVNRPTEIPESLTSMGIIQNCSIAKIASREEIEADDDAKALLGYASIPDVTPPKAPSKLALPEIEGDTIVSLKKVTVEYQRVVLDKLDFEVKKGQQWHIMGPNGAGKSTLLSLITGDNPLVYANDVTVFGFKRGTGESIWDIKKYYGVVSGALHLDYRVNGPALNVVLSGFYDSIGLYNKPSDEEITVARKWLQLAGLADKEHESFKSLSFGQQRLLLIVRALVKNPPLLILDEPLQGLDGYSRALVKSFISYVMKNSRTSILFVSHHQEDLPDGFTNRLSFVPSGDGNFKVVQEKLN
ncbi:MAG: molybdate ABC transporter ATP-binding protein ModF [Aeromonadales bacterium]|nr:molybdate ABC transporter ATP-binding protein ModF [Aeromonadales bacterium]